MAHQRRSRNCPDRDRSEKHPNGHRRERLPDRGNHLRAAPLRRTRILLPFRNRRTNSLLHGILTRHLLPRRAAKAPVRVGYPVAELAVRVPDAPEDCPCLQFHCGGTVLTFRGIHRQADHSTWPVRVIVAVRALYRMSPAAGHEAEQPADSCDNEEDHAYPQQPVQGLREAAHQQKDNCNYTSNDQKRVHGQHIPFWGNPQRIFWIPDYAFLFTSTGTWERSTASEYLLSLPLPVPTMGWSSPDVNSNTLHCTTKHPYERVIEVAT